MSLDDAPLPAFAPLRSALENLEGVRHASVEHDGGRVWIACDRTDLPMDLRIRSLFTEHGLPAGTPLEIAWGDAPEPRRRVRFQRATLTQIGYGRGRADVTVEWGDRSYTGSAEGESHSAMELRLFALATLQCLEAVVGAQPGLALVGIKLVRAFDADVAVVLLRAGAGTSLVGASLAPEDIHRAVALSVLNATNRLFGNYLNVPS